MLVTRSGFSNTRIPENTKLKLLGYCKIITPTINVINVISRVFLIMRSLLLLLLLLLCSPLLGLGRLFSFLIRYRVGRIPWTGISLSQGLYLHTEQHEQNKRRQTSMHLVGFEPTIPAVERVEAVHALDRAANVIGIWKIYILKIHNLIIPILIYAILIKVIEPSTAESWSMSTADI
jgi:hypothetical protein